MKKIEININGLIGKEENNTLEGVKKTNSNGILNEKRALKIMRENKGDGEWQKPREVIENGLADFIIEDDFIIEKRQSFILRIFNKLKNIF